LNSTGTAQRQEGTEPKNIWPLGLKKQARTLRVG